MTNDILLQKSKKCKGYLRFLQICRAFSRKIISSVRLSPQTLNGNVAVLYMYCFLYPNIYKWHFKQIKWVNKTKQQPIWSTYHSCQNNLYFLSIFISKITRYKHMMIKPVDIVQNDLKWNNSLTLKVENYFTLYFGDVVLVNGVNM